MRKPCSQDGCSRPSYTGGRCHRHYIRQLCQEDGCERHVHARGRCHTHYSPALAEAEQERQLVRARRDYPSTHFGVEEWYQALHADDGLFFNLLDAIAGKNLNAVNPSIPRAQR